MENPNPTSIMFKLIGEIIVEWAKAENIVDQTAAMIEWRASHPTGSHPNFTNMSLLRSFRHRRGHVRKLVEGFGMKEITARLDEAYQMIANADKTRHSLAHDRIQVSVEGESYTIRALRPGYRKNDGGAEKILSHDDLLAALKNLRSANTIMKMEVQATIFTKNV